MHYPPSNRVMEGQVDHLITMLGRLVTILEQLIE